MNSRILPWGIGQEFIIYFNSFFTSKARVYLLILIPILLSAAFIAIVERKDPTLGQFYLNLDKLSWVEFLQPVIDALKLFSNQVRALPISRNSVAYLLSPMVGLVSALLIWILVPLIFSSLPVKYISVIIIVLRLGVYPLLLSGWVSNSKHARLESFRRAARTISYEICLALILLALLLNANPYEFEEIIKFSKLFTIIMIFPFRCLLWLVSCIAEISRSTSDLSEGKRFDYHKKPLHFLWVRGSIWMSLYLAARLPLSIFFNMGHCFSKISDFSWLIYFFLFNSVFSWLGSLTGFSFQKLTFIRLFGYSAGALLFLLLF